MRNLSMLDILLADEMNREEMIERERELYFDYQTADNQYDEYLRMLENYESGEM